MTKMVVIIMSLLCLAASGFAQPKLRNLDGQYAEGQLLTDFGNGVQDAEILVTDQAGALLPVVVTTKASGHFTLYGISGSRHFYVKPFKNDDWANGLDVWDLYLLKQALASSFDSPYQKLAADVNGDQVVDEQDALALNDLILGRSFDLDRTLSWRFYDANCLPPMASPFGACAKTKEFVLNGNKSYDLNFVAIKVGDLNSSAICNKTQNTETYFYDDVLLNTHNQKMLPGKEYELSFSVTKDQLAAYQFSLNLGSLEFLDFVGDDVGLGHQVTFFEGQNILSFALLKPADNQLFRIKVRATEEAMLSDVLSLDTGGSVAKVYDEDEKAYALKLSFDGQKLNRLVLYQNMPNPFGDKTSIRFFLPKPSTAHLIIYNMNGLKIKNISKDFEAGMNQVLLEKSIFEHSGIYFYKLETDGQSAMRKMMVLE